MPNDLYRIIYTGVCVTGTAEIDGCTLNSQKQPSTQQSPALWIEGDKNRIVGNAISRSASHSIVIKGNGNILLNNIVDKDIIIDGNNNVVSGTVFTSPDAKVVVSPTSKGTEFVNVPEYRIIYKI